MVPTRAIIITIKDDNDGDDDDDDDVERRVLILVDSIIDVLVLVLRPTGRGAGLCPSWFVPLAQLSTKYE